MSEPSHPLDRPLPPDVAAGEAAFIQFYQKYAVFSWPWAWRRTVIFGSLGVLGGNLVRRVARPDGRDVSGRPSSVSLVGSAGQSRAGRRGPAAGGILPAQRLAAARRARRRRRRGDLRHGARHAVADEFADAFPRSADGRARLRSASPDGAAADRRPFDRAHALDVSRDLLILFIASGGLALAGVFLRVEALGGASPARRAREAEPAEERSGPAAHAAAGAGRAALPVQHAGIGALARDHRTRSAPRRPSTRSRSICAPRCRSCARRPAWRSRRSASSSRSARAISSS